MDQCHHSSIAESRTLISHRVALSYRTTNDPRDVASPLQGLAILLLCALDASVYYLSRHTKRPDFSAKYEDIVLPIRASIMPYVEGPGRGERED